jgi:hypothetical protein
VASGARAAVFKWAEAVRNTRLHNVKTSEVPLFCPAKVKPGMLPETEQSRR